MKNIIVIFLIIAMFGLYYWINPNWIYPSANNADFWAYIGASQDYYNLRNKIAWYDLPHPLTDLMPVHFPPALFYSVLPSFWANLVWKCCLFSSILFLFFLIMKKLCGEKTALLSLIVFATYQIYLQSVAADYTDSCVILYSMVAIYYGIRNRYIVAGFFASMSIWSAILSVLLLPIYFIFIGTDKRKFYSFSVGILAGTASLSIVNYFITGDFVFFRGTMTKIFYCLENTYWAKLNILCLDWLSMPMMILIAAPLFWMNFRKYWPWYLAFIVILAEYFGLQIFKNQETVSNIWYFNQIMPLQMICLGVFVINPLSIKRCFFPCMIAAVIAINLPLLERWECGNYKIFKAVNDWISLVKKIDPAREASIWYNKYSVPCCFSASTHGWQEKTLNEALPDLRAKMHQAGWKNLGQTKRMLVIVADEKEWRATNYASLNAGYLFIAMAIYRIDKWTMYDCEIMRVTKHEHLISD